MRFQKIKSTLGLIVLIVAAAGLISCAGEDGKAPSTGGGTPPTDTVPPPPGGDPPGGAASPWKLTLTVSAPDPAADDGVNISRLAAGEDPAATDLFDNGRDARALLSGTLDVYFDHSPDAGYDGFSKKIWHDIRSPGLPKDWNVAVKAGSGVTVTMTWTLPAGEVGCATNQFVLEDSAGVIPPTNLCGNEALQFTGDGQPRYFVLRISWQEESLGS